MLSLFKSCSSAFCFLTIVSLCFFLVPVAVQAAKRKDLGSSSEKVETRLFRKLNLKNYGSWLVRYGDLNGDGEADILFVQVDRKRRITCLTAIEMNGRILWQQGKPNKRHYSITADAPVQIVDFYGDARNEVVLSEGGYIKVLEGETGTLIKSAPKSCIDGLFFMKSSIEKPGLDRLFCKTSHFSFSALDTDFNVLWSGLGNLGHYPLELDDQSSGIRGLLYGFGFYNLEGVKIWSLGNLGPHNDAADVGDIDNDGDVEIALASSGPGYLVSSMGQIKWKRPIKHAQHAIIGCFRKPRDQRQITFVDRQEAGTIITFDKDGKELWRSSPQGMLTMISALSGWSVQKEMESIIAFRRSLGPPVIIDGYGKVITVLPMFKRGDKELYKEQHFVQHFNAFNEESEAIFINNRNTLWIYRRRGAKSTSTPVSQSQNPRLYNASFYIGMQ